ncbi:uncharacterized protein KY384_002991 [Bacidia gigantensis]|uniref:uncharacterized protein n=1 Tax=Bacidia gigantensis TaxID=2732470 RepID=UPI001D046C8C|nr:uncharacterized protein KY384_002991 [Bacidia gigantensis]KAG8531362.1 hypothetical protein KY384_002991 [Bacidia gigantensis]
MPRVLSYTPAWLSRPSPGFDLFNAASQPQNLKSHSANDAAGGRAYCHPDRSIARRNTEIFVADGKQIRWADLPSVKDQWQALQETPSKKPRSKGALDTDEGEDEDAAGDGSYRLLKVSVGSPIRQLCISPNLNLMAIATSHTVQIAILPKPDLLNAQHNREPLKLKTYTVGPTTHVLLQSPLASILWHPLGERGNCLVTVTEDAVIRLWEFNPDNRWSADRPKVALDLRKLAVAESEQDDVAPNRSNRNKVYTSDAAGMDVAACCFGGAGYGDETPWSSMTLWVAMQGGDIYAICPLLPSSFQPPTDLIPMLSANIVENCDAKEESREEEPFIYKQYQAQLQWMHKLDNEEPIVIDSDDGPVEIYKEPSRHAAIPRLQGPFQLYPEDVEIDLDITDIHVIPAKAKVADEFPEDAGSDLDPDVGDDDDALSNSLISVVTNEGRVYICLDIEGVQAQWLPGSPASPEESPPIPYLVVLEGLDTLKRDEGCQSEWPTFTEDVLSRYSFFITHSRGVYYFSLSPWLQMLEKELQASDSEGVQFRLSILRNNLNTLRERILTFPEPTDSDKQPFIPACQVFQDSDLGYFLLTTSSFRPQAAILDQPRSLTSALTPNSTDEDDIDALLPPAITYPAYQPSAAFYTRNTLTDFLDTHIPSRHRTLSNQPIRLSAATLDGMTTAHRVLSKETHNLGLAAADLFRRCHQLLEVLKHQVMRAQELGERVDHVTGEDDAEAEEEADGTKRNISRALETRILRTRERQEHLQERWEELRSRVRQLAGGELGRREREWVHEIQRVSQKILENGKDGREEREDGEVSDAGEEREEGEVVDDADRHEGKDDVDGGHKPEFLERWREVRRLKEELVVQAKEVGGDAEGGDEDGGKGHGDGEVDGDGNGEGETQIPPEYRKKKMLEVRKMLEKETMLVNEAQAKLERLGIAGPVL